MGGAIAELNEVHRIALVLVRSVHLRAVLRTEQLTPLKAAGMYLRHI